MNTGQMMLVIGAFGLFGMISTNMRMATFQGSQSITTNVHSQEAITIARSILDAMQTKPFDFICNTKQVVRLSDLTPSSGLGPAYGEYYPAFNDVDDFNNQVYRSPNPGMTPSPSLPDALRSTEGYTVKCDVKYVTPSNPNIVSSTATFSKRATVTVYNKFSSDTLRMSYIAAY